MKVIVVVGTRPELIRLSRIIALLRETTDCTLVHTGQNFSYELGEIFYDDLSIQPPDYYLGAVGTTLAETIGLIIARSDEVFAAVQPDALLVLGDTNSALSVIPAKRRKIPVFHYEAGNRCFDQRVPEEINRKIVDHTSDINLTYSSIAKENLLREGVPMDRVFNIGSPLYEVLRYYSTKISRSNAVESLGLTENQYFVLSAHREENVDQKERLEELVESLRRIKGEYGYPIVFSVHPRTEKRLEQYGFKLDDIVVRHKPFAFTDYVALQQKAYCVLSDSGTISEESSILGFPAVNLRYTHERQEAMEKAVVVMANLNKGNIPTAIKASRRQRDNGVVVNPIDDYHQECVSDKILRIILSYTDYVNERIWFKPCSR